MLYLFFTVLSSSGIAYTYKVLLGSTHSQAYFIDVIKQFTLKTVMDRVRTISLDLFIIVIKTSRNPFVTHCYILKVGNRFIITVGYILRKTLSIPTVCIFKIPV